MYLDDGTHLAQLKVYNEQGMVTEDYIFETSGLNPKPTTFDWDYNSARQNAYNALVGKGETTEFKASVWRDIRRIVAAFINYKHLNKVEIGPNNYGIDESALLGDVDSEANISSTSTADKTLYARKFNILRYLVDLMNSFDNGSNSIENHYLNTGSWDFDSGEKVMGSYILDLVDYMNGIE